MFWCLRYVPTASQEARSQRGGGRAHLRSPPRFKPPHHNPASIGSRLTAHDRIDQAFIHLLDAPFRPMKPSDEALEHTEKESSLRGQRRPRAAPFSFPSGAAVIDAPFDYASDSFINSHGVHPALCNCEIFYTIIITFITQCRVGPIRFLPNERDFSISLSC